MLAIASTIACFVGAAEARELKVGTNIWSGYEPLYVAANHMPDFGSADIDIQRFSDRITKKVWCSIH